MPSEMRFYNSEIPEAFKPSIADKFMFNQIIDLTIKTIKRDLKTVSFIGTPTESYRSIALQILLKFYYPQYGVWRKLDRDEARKRYCAFRREYKINNIM